MKSNNKDPEALQITIIIFIAVPYNCRECYILIRLSHLYTRHDSRFYRLRITNYRFRSRDAPRRFRSRAMCASNSTYAVIAKLNLRIVAIHEQNKPFDFTDISTNLMKYHSAEMPRRLCDAWSRRKNGYVRGCLSSSDTTP